MQLRFGVMGGRTSLLKLDDEMSGEVQTDDSPDKSPRGLLAVRERYVRER